MSNPVEQSAPCGAAAERPQKKQKTKLAPVNIHSDDEAAPLLPVYVRFKDLVAARIVRNWPSLLRLIDDQGFPSGVMLGDNTRAWQLVDVRAWLGGRPTARKIVPPRSKKEEAA